MPPDTPLGADGQLSGRLSINEFMLPDSTFEDDLETCIRAGAAGIGVWEDRITPSHDADLAAALARSGLSASLCVTTAPSILPLTFLEGPADPRERVDLLVASIERLAPFDPSAFLVITGADDSMSPAEQRRTVVEGLRRIGQAAGEIDAVIAVEPMRGRPSDSLVATVAEAADLVSEVAVPNVGILYDVWHHWDSPTLTEDIADHAALFTAVQLGDWPDRPDPGHNRVVPGTGLIPLDRIFAALETAGYRGWYDLELVADAEAPDSPLHMDRDEMLQMSRRGLEAAWARAHGHSTAAGHTPGSLV